jgi:hypothetical protein
MNGLSYGIEARWEYRIETIRHRDGTHSSSISVHPDDFLAVVKPLGDEGWEVYHVAGSMVYLKRQREHLVSEAK